MDKKREYRYKRYEDKKSDGFTAHISKGNAELLDIYCRINNLNKTKYINDLLGRDMVERFAVLRGGTE